MTTCEYCRLPMTHTVTVVPNEHTSICDSVEPPFHVVCQTHADFFTMPSIKRNFDVAPCSEEELTNILAWY